VHLQHLEDDERVGAAVVLHHVDVGVLEEGGRAVGCGWPQTLAGRTCPAACRALLAAAALTRPKTFLKPNEKASLCSMLAF
jgi:hypothetical protein